MPRPPSELSSGMNGDPVCPAPCTASYRAVRMVRAESRNACAAHCRDGGQPYPRPAMLASSRAREVSNSVKKVLYDVPEFKTPWSSGLSPRFAPVLEIFKCAPVATRTIGTDPLPDSRPE